MVFHGKKGIDNSPNLDPHLLGPPQDLLAAAAAQWALRPPVAFSQFARQNVAEVADKHGV